MIRRPLIPTLFPYTTLFRSHSLNIPEQTQDLAWFPESYRLTCNTIEASVHDLLARRRFQGIHQRCHLATRECRIPIYLLPVFYFLYSFRHQVKQMDQNPSHRILAHLNGRGLALSHNAPALKNLLIMPDWQLEKCYLFQSGVA